MISFENDYSEGCHPKILEALVRTNLEQLPGYGADKYTASAADKIRAAVGLPEAQVCLLSGGTMVNQLIIDTMLRPYEGVLSADTGHINTHEAGAIEFTGHKVLALPSDQGKVRARDVRDFLRTFYQDGNHEHMVFPGMLYISHPTEYGTLYTKGELQALAEVCREYRIPLYLDGARLGYGLAARDTDVSLRDIAAAADVFYIGGTKVGALSGEAVVFTRRNMPERFLTQVKRHGDLAAKGRLLGVQFDTLFTDGLYFQLGEHAIRMAERLKAVFRDRGYAFYLDSPTNQQFLIVANDVLEKLRERVRYAYWEPYDGTHAVVRFATSWATTEARIRELAAILDEIGPSPAARPGE